MWSWILCNTWRRCSQTWIFSASPLLCATLSSKPYKGIGKGWGTHEVREINKITPISLAPIESPLAEEKDGGNVAQLPLFNALFPSSQAGLCFPPPFHMGTRKFLGTRRRWKDL